MVLERQRLVGGGPLASSGETMDSLAEPQWPPGLAVMKVSASETLGAPGCLRGEVPPFEEDVFALRRKDEARA